MSSLGNFPDPFLTEIVGQPDAVRRAASALSDHRGSLGKLQDAGERATTLIFTGMGGSYDTCYPAISQLAGRGIPALLIDTAELLHFRKPILGSSALVIAVSQSGESAELVELASTVQGQASRPFLVSITNGLDNTLARGADVALDTRAGKETGPSTMTFGASLVTLSAVTHILSGVDVSSTQERVGAAAGVAAAAGERLLPTPEQQAEELTEWQRGRGTIVLLGRGPARAASEMGSLLLKESAGIPAEALQAAQFRHGPLELAGPNLAAIVIATEPETRQLDLGLAADLVATGAAVLVVTPDGEGPEGARLLAIGHLDRALAPAVSIVPVQLLAWRLAIQRGRTPGVLSRATKVTTRE
jgi:glutamine---fructose-6-phosphate transaminase (isomerizing)